ncbi:MAG: DNA mismatch repair endonuclease MutL [Phycisphaerales bacterium]|nr:DNA mismatch repair endonuclease MutL [Phycisphaerales bacterium]
MPIRRLSQTLVSQIAAGEVVERPASVVKELLENAFDAGATRVEVDLEGGGRDLVRIRDDGGGIPRDELPLAIAAHATSKITELADLEAVATMGFRGEALASIASVSRLRLVSRTPSSDEAWALEVAGEECGDPSPTAGPPGTSIEVRTLFFNTPARRRFLKSERAETSRVSDVVRMLGLSRPGVAITLRSEGRTLVDLPAEDDPGRRIAAVLGMDRDTRLLEVRGEAGDASDPSSLVSVWGLVGLPEDARPTARHQRLVLNGRVIADRSLSHAIREGYRGLIEPGRHPVAALFLEMDPRRVDVNVHPAKTEVRFRESRPLFSLIRRSIESALSGADLVPSITLSAGGDVAGEAPVSQLDDTAFEAAEDPGIFGGPASPAIGLGRAGGGGSGGSRGSGSGHGASKGRGSWGGEVDMEAIRARLAEPVSSVSSTETPLPRVLGSDEVLQVHHAFLVTQDEAGLVIIDQHALHERVMFEKLKSRMAQGPLESQRLAVPAPLELDPVALSAIEDLQPLLVDLGIEIELSGPRSAAVHAFPSLLFERKVDPVEFMENLLERTAAGEFELKDRETALGEVLDMMSCKAAVKAGDRLTSREIGELLEMRREIDRSSNCPHGRPTHLRIPIADLERKFGRSTS